MITLVATRSLNNYMRSVTNKSEKDENDLPSVQRVYNECIMIDKLAVVNSHGTECSGRRH